MPQHTLLAFSKQTVPRPNHVFTSDQARQAGIKSGEVRRAWREQRANPPLTPSDVPPDPFTDDLACACGEALKALRSGIKRGKPQAVAQLARALRDLRETWHMATGKPKPGMTRPVQESAAAKFRQMPRVTPVLPSAPLPEPAPATGSVEGVQAGSVPEPANPPSL